MVLPVRSETEIGHAGFDRLTAIDDVGRSGNVLGFGARQQPIEDHYDGCDARSYE